MMAVGHGPTTIDMTGEVWKSGDIQRAVAWNTVTPPVAPKIDVGWDVMARARSR